MIGQKISHYQILEKLGEGGMGVVYKAQDTKLDRLVALKFLPQRLHASDEEKARFLQEAKAAATLNHPNVCTIYDIKEEEGKNFIVMEFVDGVTLREKFVENPIPVKEAVTYAIQIGEALEEAHNKGIVHRDIKSDNIMVNKKNQIKVMDFGLAKLKGSLKLTKATSTVGTLGYMAPEQIQGGETDARSDIFSFGIVLFEMLTRKLPFRGEHDAALMYSILNEEPDSILKYHPELSLEFVHFFARGLEKDPQDRFQSAADMVSELRRIHKQSSRVSRTHLAAMPSVPEQFPSLEPQRTKKTLMLSLLGVVIVAAFVASYLVFFAKPQQDLDSIAVLPFVNVNADPNTEYLSDGITESVINNLTKLKKLRVVPRSSVFYYKGKDVAPQQAGSDLNVSAVLSGRVVQRGENLSIQTELIDIRNNAQLWGEQYNRKVDDLIALQDEISREIVNQLRVQLTGEEKKQLAQRATENTDAYQLYLKGRFYWNKRTKDGLNKAVDYYTQAIEKDPNYALAYAGLASTYALLPEYAGLQPKEMMPKARAAATKALEIDSKLAEAYAVLGLVKEQYDWDWEGAEKDFKRSIELNPNYPTVHHWYSICLRVQGRLEEGLAEIKQAQELDPLSLVISTNVGETLYLMRQYDRAMEQVRKTIELDPNFPLARIDLGLIYEQQGKFEEAIAEFQNVRKLLGDDPYGMENLGHAYAVAGRRGEAVKILNELQQLSKQGFSLPYQIALVYAGLGEKEKTFEWLQRTYEEHNSWLVYIKMDPLWQNLRSEPRFIALLKNIGLEK